MTLVRRALRGRAAGGAVALCALMAFSLPAAAADVPLPVGYEEVQAQLEHLGVDEATGESLIRRLDAGYLWDSLTDARPVAVETVEADGGTATRYTFADGSVSQVSLGVPAQGGGGGGLLAPTGLGAVPLAAPAPGTYSSPVTGCTAIPNDGAWLRRTGCLARVQNAYVDMSFRVDYSVVSKGGRIDQVSRPNVKIFAPRTFVSYKLAIQRPVSVGETSAMAKMEVSYISDYNGRTEVTSFTVEAWGSCWFTRQGYFIL